MVHLNPPSVTPPSFNFPGREWNMAARPRYYDRTLVNSQDIFYRISELHKAVTGSIHHLPASMSANDDPDSLDKDGNVHRSNQTQLLEL